SGDCGRSRYAFLAKEPRRGDGPVSQSGRRCKLRDGSRKQACAGIGVRESPGRRAGSMKFPLLRPLFCLACVLALSGCDTFGGVSDTVSGWFSSTPKSKLKGERISVMATDTSLKPDQDVLMKAVV